MLQKAMIRNEALGLASSTVGLVTAEKLPLLESEFFS